MPDAGVAPKMVVMARTDGLGERLCSMMNAIRLAEMLDSEFRFHWTSDIWNPVYHKLDVQAGKPVLGQSIAPQEELFDPDFIASTALPSYDKSQYLPFPAKPLTAGKIRAAEQGKAFLGWMPNQNFLAHECDPAFMRTSRLSYRDAFERIGFHPAIQAVIDQAVATDLPDFDAIHLRSGDMVFGEVRKWGQWQNKVLNPCVARHFIQEIRNDGRQVLLFGQDVEGLRSLAQREGSLFVGDFLPEPSLSTTERALFEIVLMSRAQRVIAGYSGFSRAACMIGDIKVTTPSNLLKPAQYAEITLAELAANEANYHPMVAAYAYWQAQEVATPLFNLPQRLTYTDRAHHLDPENLMHLVNRMALQYLMGQDAAAEQAVSDHAARTGLTPEAAREKIADQLVFKYYSTDHTHRAQFPVFQGAALRSGNDHARYFNSRIKLALSTGKK